MLWKRRKQIPDTGIRCDLSLELCDFQALRELRTGCIATGLQLVVPEIGINWSCGLLGIMLPSRWLLTFLGLMYLKLLWKLKSTVVAVIHIN